MVIKTVIILALISLSLKAAKPPEGVNVNQVVESCVEQVAAQGSGQLSRDVICDFIYQVRAVGDDAIEAVKVFFKLTPRDYALLTAANMAATGRVRFQTKSFLHKDFRHTFDFRSDSYLVTIETQF